MPAFLPLLCPGRPPRGAGVRQPPSHHALQTSGTKVHQFHCLVTWPQRNCFQTLASWVFSATPQGHKHRNSIHIPDNNTVPEVLNTAKPPRATQALTHTLSSHVHLLMHTRSFSHARKSKPRTGKDSGTTERCAKRPQGAPSPPVEAEEDRAAGNARVATASGSLLAEEHRQGPPGH